VLLRIATLFFLLLLARGNVNADGYLLRARHFGVRVEFLAYGMLNGCSFLLRDFGIATARRHSFLGSDEEEAASRKVRERTSNFLIFFLSLFFLENTRDIHSRRPGK
jgi:hypothetical protein